MNQTVKKMVDLLFEDTVENEETQALHEELLNNCQEHYEDLIQRGLMEEEAAAEVADSLKGMKDVIAEYPRKSALIRGEDAHAAEGGSYAGIRVLRVESSDQDLYVSPSGDGELHVFCDDPEGMSCEREGDRLLIRGAKKSDRLTSPFEMEEGTEVSLTGLLNMVGKAIRNVADSFSGGLPIRIKVPEESLAEMELNTRSGDIQCSCAFIRKMTVRSTSGDIRLNPETERTADSLLVTSVSGDAEVNGSAMTGEVISMSGDVTVDGVFETLKLRSTSGDAEFTGSVSEITAASVSGDAEMTIENSGVRRIEAHSTSGDVQIRLPAALPGVHAECSSVSGEVLSRISEAGVGAPLQIRARSVSGDVSVG